MYHYLVDVFLSVGRTLNQTTRHLRGDYGTKKESSCFLTEYL